MNETEVKRWEALINEVKEIFDEQSKWKKSGTCNKHLPDLKMMDKRLHEIEYELQKLKKYNNDIDYHIFWYQQPCCNCPKLDNDEKIGVSHKVVSLECIIHHK